MSTLIKIITIFIISFSVFFPAKGAIVYQTKALHPSIQTIRTRVFDKAYFPPVIRLDNDDQLIVSFDNYETTDDHGMQIVGTAVDQNGNKYYKVKNSWGTDNDYDGYFYASEPFVLYKTISYVVNKNAIPKDIQKRLNLK